MSIARNRRIRTNLRKLVLTLFFVSTFLSITTSLITLLGVYTNWQQDKINTLRRERYYDTLTGAIIEHYYTQRQPCSFKNIKTVLKTVDTLVPSKFKSTPITEDDLLAIAIVESGFSTNLIGKHGERGVFQIKDWRDVLRELGMPLADPFDPKVNTQMACHVLYQKYQQRKTYKETIIAYNGYVMRDGKLVETYWHNFLKARKIVEELKKEAKGM